MSIAYYKKKKTKFAEILHCRDIWSCSLLKMQGFAFFVAYVLLVEEKYRRERIKGSVKGKEIREHGAEDAEGTENSAVVDGVERRDRSMSVVFSRFYPQKVTEDPPLNLHYVCLWSLL